VSERAIGEATLSHGLQHRRRPGLGRSALQSLRHAGRHAPPAQVCAGGSGGVVRRARGLAGDRLACGRQLGGRAVRPVRPPHVRTAGGLRAPPAAPHARALHARCDCVNSFQHASCRSCAVDGFEHRVRAVLRRRMCCPHACASSSARRVAAGALGRAARASALCCVRGPPAALLAVEQTGGPDEAAAASAAVTRLLSSAPSADGGSAWRPVGCTALTALAFVSQVCSSGLQLW
jgi:hypothetical protein